MVTSRKDVAIFEGFVSFAALDSVDLVSVEEAIKLDFAFALQNNSEFLGMFNYHIGKMKSSGVHTKLSQKWLRCKFMEKGKSRPAATRTLNNSIEWINHVNHGSTCKNFEEVAHSISHMSNLTPVTISLRPL